MSDVLGLHHVTAIAGDPQRNLDFYAGLLGLRLVKRTVNFDDPQTYHLYYGDEVGTPGGILTFFPWPGARSGRQGAGQVAVTAFSLRPASLGFWIERLLRHGVRYQGPTRRGPRGAEGEQVIALRDPDGLLLELVAHAAAEHSDRPVWGGAPGVPAEHAIRGFHGVTLWLDDAAASESVLADTLGFRPLREDGSTRRYEVGSGGPGRWVDVREVGGFPAGWGGAGTVHHVAFAVPDDASQLVARNRVLRAGLHATAVIDRKYFRSVYFREPGGVLYELATVPPGFAVDEPVERLGDGLMLPDQYEPQRAEIEAILPRIHLPLPAPGGAALVGAGGPEEVGGDALGFVHRYIPPGAGAELAGDTTLLLLHGTGGDETDLLPLGRALLPGAGLLSPRGNVDEHGAARFFRRLAPGVFDLDDLTRRTDELAEFVHAATRTYGLDPSAIVAVGFSNGANIAASLLLRHPGLLAGAVLLSPMLPYEPESPPDLVGTSVFVGAGRADPIAPPSQVKRLAELLRGAGAAVSVHWEPGGHALTEAETSAAGAWLAALQPPRPAARPEPGGTPAA